MNPLLCDEPLTEHDGELRLGGGPLAWRHLPRSIDLAQHQEQHLVAASSSGKWPRLRTAVRSLLLRLSMALVV